MKTLEQLYNWFYLNNRSGNSLISNCEIPLRVAPIRKVNNYKNPEIDNKHFAFAEKNKKWEIEYFHGLKNFLWIENKKLPPIFIFDNHNHALIFRYNIIYNKNFKNIELIHIDQHSDCRENKNYLELNLKDNELEKVFKFWNVKCNVGNFIPPAIKSWIISNQTQIRSTTALQNLKSQKKQNFILDIDLDFCLEWTNKDKIDKKALNILKDKFNEIWQHAIWITIATSPYFLDQESAIKIIKELFVK